MKGKNSEEIAAAMEILLKNQVEVFFMFKGNQAFYQIRNKRNWRVYNSNTAQTNQVRGTPAFIKFRCQKLLLKI